MKNRRLFIAIKNSFLLIISLILLQPTFTSAQTRPVKAWDKTIGGNNLDRLSAATQTSDGGCILGGWSYSGIGGDKSQPSRSGKDYWIVKLDSLRNKLWDKTFGGSGNDSLLAVIQTTDGGYLIGGASNSNQSIDKTQASKGSYDYWVLKLDATGNKIWDKTIGGSSFDNLESLQQTTDGGFILGGTSNSGISGDRSQASKGGSDYWMIKLNVTGNILWDKAIGGISSDEMTVVRQTSDGGYLLGGSSRSMVGADKTQPSVGYTDFWVVKLNAAGNKIWDRTFGGVYMDYLLSMEQTTDGGFILGGTQYAPSSTVNVYQANCWLIKIDSVGIKQWDKIFAGPEGDGISSVKQTADGGYILGGASASNISADKSQNCLGLNDFWVIKTDGYGNKIWDSTIGGTNVDAGEAIEQTPDEGFFVAGFSSSSISIDKSENSRGSTDYWVVKLMPVPGIQTNFGGTFCAGSTITIPFTLTGTFNAGNIFTAQLSDANGSFANPITIGTLNSITAGSIAATIPSGLMAGTQYRVRVIASNMPTIGSASLNTITIENAPLPTGISAMRCGNGIVDLGASGAPVGGHYQWYTSATGATAITGATSAIYTTPNLSSTAIYYVTTISASGCESAPRVAVTATIHDVPAAPKVSSAERCGSGSVILSASGAPIGGGYKWYATVTGGAAINVTNDTIFPTPNLAVSTTYYAATVSSSGCESTLRTPVTATINPVPDKPTITFVDGLLTSSISTNIQWYRNDTLLTGANERDYKPTINGNYVVKAILGNCESTSEKYSFTVLKSNCEFNFKVYPNPTSDKFKIKYFGCKSTVTITVFNSIGQKISNSIKIEDYDDKQRAEIDASSWSKGLYILELKTEEKTIYSKIIKE